MNQVKNRCSRAYIQMRNGMYRAARKLRERGGASEYVAVLVLVVIVVVIGGILMAKFGVTFSEIWETVATRIKDLFNYS